MIEKEVLTNFFTHFSNKNKNKIYSRYTALAPVLAEKFNHIIRDLLKRPVFGKADGNWLDALPTITNQNDERKHSSTKLTPIQDSLKKNEELFTKNYKTNEKKLNQKK